MSVQKGDYPHGEVSSEGDRGFSCTISVMSVAREYALRLGSSFVLCAPNGDSWTGISDTQTSGAIQDRTLYTLTCQSAQGEKTKTTAVDISTTWNER